MASQKVFGSYQEIIDLHTEANHVSAIGIHTPTGDTPRKMFKGYFDQYKKYKYLGASITLVPAARLPADPMGVSYNSTGQVEGTAMDPRDALNPIMFHGCHGDDMGAILNTLYGNNSSISDSVDGLDGGAVSITDFVGASLWINMERLYYKALTDKTWKKANPMSGFKKGNLRPLVYSLATNRQIMPYEGSPSNINALTQGGDPTTQIVEDDDGLWAPARANNLQFFTPRLTRLGWMETRNVHAIQKSGIEGIESADDIPEFIAQALDTTTTPAEMPKIYMGIILMAPAYGVEQYYRMIVNHRFAFKEFRGISFMPATDGVPSYVNANPDLFNGDTYEDWESGEGGEVDPPTPPGPEPPLGETLILNRKMGSKYVPLSGWITFDNDLWLGVYNGFITADDVTGNASISVSGTTGFPGVVFGFGVDGDNYLRYVCLSAENVSGEPRVLAWIYDKELDSFFPASMTIADGVLSFTITSQTSAGSFSTFTKNGMGADAFSTDSRIYSLIDTNAIAVTFDDASW